MGSAIEDAWDSVTGFVEDTFNWKTYERDPLAINPVHRIAKKTWGDAGGAKAWENLGDSISGVLGAQSYDLTASGAKSAAAIPTEADKSGIPAVAQSISGNAAQAVEAQGTARKRARGIMQTYTRYDSGGNGGKSKLGE